LNNTPAFDWSQEKSLQIKGCLSFCSRVEMVVPPRLVYQAVATTMISNWERVVGHLV
jgi:hypothetical protein